MLLKMMRDYRIKKSLTNACDALTRLHQSFFGSYLKQDNLIKQSKTLYQQQVKFIKKLQTAYHTCHYRLRRNDREMGDNDIKFLIKIENLHEVICSLHLLRYRFNEFALFEVCFREMQDLQKTSTALLYKLTRDFNAHLDTTEFINSIQAFENLFSSTLQVVARDPKVFQFFIQDLYALNALLMHHNQQP